MNSNGYVPFLINTLDTILRMDGSVHEVSRKKSTAKAKLKATSQQERIQLWKQHFENLLGNPPKVTQEPITRIICKQLDIKLGQFTQEAWKAREFDDILLRHCNAVYNQNTVDRWIKGCILTFPKKGDLGLAKNYRCITPIFIAAKIYNALLTQLHRTLN